MSWLRTLLLPLLIGSIMLLAGAIGQQPSRPSSLLPPPAPAKAEAQAEPKADAKATAILDDAIMKLDPKRLAWVETILWQQGDMQGLTFRVEGKYVSGPEHRLHLDMSLHLGETTGKLEVVSDGQWIWELIQIGEKDRQITKKKLAKLLETVNHPNMVEQVREEFFQTQSFSGVRPLLQSIKQRMTVTEQEKVRWNGREMVRLTAVWSPDTLKILKTQTQWPPSLPRLCRLYLMTLPDKTPWPYRLEWWGPVLTQASDELLLQMEFRHPKVNHELSPERIAAEFKFDDPGKNEAKDETNPLAEELYRKGLQLAVPKKTK